MKRDGLALVRAAAFAQRQRLATFGFEKPATVRSAAVVMTSDCNRFREVLESQGDGDGARIAVCTVRV